MPTATAAYAPRPKPKRVTFDLTASARVRNKYGSDVFSQIIHMRLDGMTIVAIRKATGVCEDTIGGVISLWQATVAGREGPNWKPLARNRRKTRSAQPPYLDTDFGQISEKF